MGAPFSSVLGLGLRAGGPGEEERAAQGDGGDIPGVPHGAGEVEGGDPLPEGAAEEEKGQRRPPAPLRRVSEERPGALEHQDHGPACEEVRPVPGEKAVEGPGGGRDEAEAV